MKGNVLITGVSSGIGKATAQKFLQEGYRVFGSVRTQAEADQLRLARGTDFIPLVFDLRDAEAIAAARRSVEQLIENQGLACLVNNAGVSVYGPVLHVPTDEWAYQYDVNVIGTIRVTQAFAPMLGARRNSSLPPGRIINISSVSGLVSRPFMGPYSSSKFALEAVSDSLRRELVMYGIKVIVIQPGPIKTEIWRKAAEEKLKFQDTDYGPMLRNVKGVVGSMESMALEPELVSDLIFNAFRSNKPKTRYLIAQKKRWFWIAAYILSDKRLDRLFQKQFDKYWNT